MDESLRQKIEAHLKKYTAHIDEETLRRIVNLNDPIRIPKGKLIFAQGAGFYLLSGIIRGFYLDMDGNDVTHLFIMEGSTYGADFLTTDKPHVCSFEALEDCVALSLNVGALRAAMETDIRLLWMYVNLLEEAMSRKITRETSLVSQTATERYLALKRQYPDIENRVSQTHIASYIGINAASLSRIRRVIREEN